MNLHQSFAINLSFSVLTCIAEAKCIELSLQECTVVLQQCLAHLDNREGSYMQNRLQRLTFDSICLRDRSMRLKALTDDFEALCGDKIQGTVHSPHPDSFLAKLLVRSDAFLLHNAGCLVSCLMRSKCSHSSIHTPALLACAQLVSVGHS